MTFELRGGGDCFGVSKFSHSDNASVRKRQVRAVAIATETTDAR
jgi:hypothetical protein